MECGECEWDLRAGHAPDCSRRCQAIDTAGTQCDHGASHKGTHAVYDEWGEQITRCWPAREGEPVREEQQHG